MLDCLNRFEGSEEAGCFSRSSPTNLWRLRHNGENQSRRPRFVVVDDVCCFDHVRSTRLILTGIQVSIKSREVAAGNLEPQLVSWQENITCRPKVYVNVINLPRTSKFRFLLRIAVAQAQNTFRQILCKSVWPDVNHFSGNVRVDRRAADIQVERNWTRNFGVLCKCWRREYEHVAARFCRPLVLRTNPCRQRLATKGPPNRGGRVVRIVYVLVGFLLGRRDCTQRAASFKTICWLCRTQVIPRRLG